jgi:phosphoribosyl 1,2-cyclic phosphate phosphodiesterase
VVDALRYEPHPTHSHLEQTLSWIDRVKPERAILTHMTWDMDYETLKSQIPDGVEVAYDGMVIDI